MEDRLAVLSLRAPWAPFGPGEPLLSIAARDTRRSQFSGWCPPTCWTVQSAPTVTLRKGDMETGKDGNPPTRDKTTRQRSTQANNQRDSHQQAKGAETPRATRSEESQPHFYRVSLFWFCHSRRRRPAPQGHVPSVNTFVALRQKSSQPIAPQGLATRQHTYFSRKNETVLEGKGGMCSTNHTRG